MRRRGSCLVLAALAAGSSVGGCAPRRPGASPDREPPVVTLQVGPSSFSTQDDGDPLDACVTVRGFPARLSVAAADRGGGGIATAVAAVFPGAISDVSATPTTAVTATSVDRGAHVLTVTTRPPAGTVQPNVLVTFQIAEPSAVRVSARDTSGLTADLYQVDIRALDDAVICRGEPPQD